MSKNLFITFEGIEGCGKTTQSKMLKHYLEKNGYDVVLSREPGGTEIGNRIREILIDPKYKGVLTPETEVLLYLADRNQHLKEKIIPSLREGKFVISDRYHYSSVAYQCFGRNLDCSKINFIFEKFIEGIEPDIVFLIDIDVETSFNRVKNRAKNEKVELSRFELEHKNFHSKIREGFLTLAKKKSNFIVIDGTKSPEEIHEIIVKETEKRINNV